MLSSPWGVYECLSYGVLIGCQKVHCTMVTSFKRVCSRSRRPYIAPQLLPSGAFLSENWQIDSCWPRNTKNFCPFDVFIWSFLPSYCAWLMRQLMLPVHDLFTILKECHIFMHYMWFAWFWSHLKLSKNGFWVVARFTSKTKINVFWKKNERSSLEWASRVRKI